MTRGIVFPDVQYPLLIEKVAGALRVASATRRTTPQGHFASATRRTTPQGHFASATRRTTPQGHFASATPRLTVVDHLHELTSRPQELSSIMWDEPGLLCNVCAKALLRSCAGDARVLHVCATIFRKRFGELPASIAASTPANASTAVL